jgi:hypothetical protein
MNFTAKSFLFLNMLTLSGPLLAQPTILNFVRRFYQESMLIQAACNGNLHNVKYYLEQGCNINTRSFPVDDGYTSLACAALEDQHHVVKYLLQQKAHTNTCKEGSTLKIAVRHNTIHTPFTVMLWGRPDKSDRDDVLKIVNKFNSGNRKKQFESMISDFERYVKENKDNLLPELSDQVKEYVECTPRFKDIEYSIGAEIMETERKFAYKFD